MSTSVLYRALGIRGYKHQSIREQDGGIVLRVRHDGSDLTCPHCGGANVWRRGTVSRSWSAPPIGNRPVTWYEGRHIGGYLTTIVGVLNFRGQHRVNVEALPVDYPNLVATLV